MTWEGWKFGPASVLGGLHLISLIALVGAGIQIVKDNQATNIEQTKELKKVVSELRQSAEVTGNRVTKVEATVDGINHSLDRIEQKVEAIRHP